MRPTKLKEKFKAAKSVNELTKLLEVGLTYEHAAFRTRIKWTREALKREALKREAQLRKNHN